MSVQEDGLRQAEDPAVLEWAAQEGRIVVTHDVSTMLDFAYERVAAGLPTPGVFEIPDQTPRSVIIEELLLVAAASDPTSGGTRCATSPCGKRRTERTAQVGPEG